MFYTGITSITFRQEMPQSIINLTKQCGLQYIEWGGDVHCPVGNIAIAQDIRNLTTAAGLNISSLGSYYNASSPYELFNDALSTAITLGTNTVRVWAGKQASDDCSTAELNNIIRNLKAICTLANAHKIDICLECHPDTLTDRFSSSLNLLQRINMPNLKMYWQPNQFLDFNYNKEAAYRLAPFCRHIHVFNWIKNERKPLSQGKDKWIAYLDIFKKSGGDHILLLEFMHDDKTKSLADTAQTLNELIT